MGEMDGCISLYNFYSNHGFSCWFPHRELRKTPERAQAIRNTGSVRQMPGSQGHQWPRPPKVYIQEPKNGEIGSLGMGFYMGLPDSFKRGLQWS